MDSAWSRLHWDFPRRRDEPTHILHYINAGKPWRAPSDAGTYGLWLEAFGIFCGKDFPYLRAKFSLLSKRRFLDHFLAQVGVTACATWHRFRPGDERHLKYWQWRSGSTTGPAARVETPQCHRLAERIREVAERR